jgi:hypothetical protein
VRIEYPQGTVDARRTGLRQQREQIHQVTRRQHGPLLELGGAALQHGQKLPAVRFDALQCLPEVSVQLGAAAADVGGCQDGGGALERGDGPIGEREPALHGCGPLEVGEEIAPVRRRPRREVPQRRLQRDGRRPGGWRRSQHPAQASSNSRV